MKYNEPWLQEWAERDLDSKKRCSRCVYDEDTPSITFDHNGVCNYCHQWDEVTSQHPTGEEGWKILQDLAEKINRESVGKKYNVIVGVSGGCDSSYVLYLAKKLGLRPLAIHYDNTWNSNIAVSNIQKMLNALDVDLETYVVNNEEVDDIFKAFFKAGVIEIDGATDIALVTSMFKAALKHGIRYNFCGHSIRTEGLSPLGWSYVDGKYIESIHKRYGTMKMKSFPNLTFMFQAWAMLKGRVRRIRPLWYMDYNKEEVKEFLMKEFDWQWYGGHHLENRMTAFSHSYYIPRGFNEDQRANGFSAMIRSGQMDRDEAIELLKQPPHIEDDLVELFKKRLNLSDDEFEHYMTQPKKLWTEFPTYKPLFERIRPLIKIAADMNFVPMSFYLKYACKQK